MSVHSYLFLMFAMAAVTYIPRMLPLVVLSRRQLPHWLAEWLELIPSAILSALLAPTLFAQGNPRTLVFGKFELLAAIPTLFFALKTRSLAGTVVIGMLFFWLAGTLLR